jgi:hypothetical protein
LPTSAADGFAFAGATLTLSFVAGGLIGFPDITSPKKDDCLLPVRPSYRIRPRTERGGNRADFGAP